MPGFKGIFDGSVTVMQNREERDAAMERQRQQIAANMAMQTQRLQVEQQQGNADRALKAQGMQADIALSGQKLGIAQQEMDLRREEFDAGKGLAETKQATATLMLQQAQQEFEDDQRQRQSLTEFRQSAFGAGLITAALHGVTPKGALSRINQANGVADEDPGAVIGMGGGPDGLWYDVIALDEQGQKGKKRQEVDPMTLLGVAHSLYGQKGATEFIQMYKTRDTNNTRMNIAMDNYTKALEVAAIKAKTAETVQGMKGEQAETLQTMKGEQAETLQGMKGEQSLAVEDKKTGRALAIQEAKEKAAAKGGFELQKANPSALLKVLSEQRDNLQGEIDAAKKKKVPLDTEKVKLLESTQMAIKDITEKAAGGKGAAGQSAATTTFKDGDTRIANGIKYTRTNGVWVAE